MTGVISRLLVGFLGPPLLGFVFWLLIATIISDSDTSIKLDDKELYVWLLVAYMYAFIQSILYSILMEYVINKHISKSIAVVLVSIALGNILGATIGLFFIGALVGGVLGIVLRAMYIHSANKSLKKGRRKAAPLS